MSVADPLAALDAVPVPQIGAAIARLAARLLVAGTDDAAAAEELLTPDDVARLLRVSRKAVYNRAKELGASRVGRRLRFSRKAVDRFVARRRT